MEKQNQRHTHAQNYGEKTLLGKEDTEHCKEDTIHLPLYLPSPAPVFLTTVLCSNNTITV